MGPAPNLSTSHSHHYGSDHRNMPPDLHNHLRVHHDNLLSVMRIKRHSTRPGAGAGQRPSCVPTQVCLNPAGVLTTKAEGSLVNGWGVQ